MNKAHCCGADQLFDLKGAEKQYKRYLKKGPRKTTKNLLKALSVHDMKGKTLLDIGGGIGSIAWSFHENGATSTIDVDASTGFLQVAREHAEKMGWSENSKFIHGDITEVSEDLPKMDFVTLDKVICCYPDFESILNSALSKCNHVIAMTFPLGGPVSRFLVFLEALFLKLKGNPFRPFIHPWTKVENQLIHSGFEPVHQSVSFPWRIWVFKRIETGNE